MEVDTYSRTTVSPNVDNYSRTEEVPFRPEYPVLADTEALSKSHRVVPLLMVLLSMGLELLFDLPLLSPISQLQAFTYQFHVMNLSSPCSSRVRCTGWWFEDDQNLEKLVSVNNLRYHALLSSL